MTDSESFSKERFARHHATAMGFCGRTQAEFEAVLQQHYSDWPSLHDAMRAAFAEGKAECEQHKDGNWESFGEVGKAIVDRLMALSEGKGTRHEQQ